MTDEHEQPGDDPEDGYDPGSDDGLAELPPSPVSSYEAERISKLTGGEIVGSIPRGGKNDPARIDFGAFIHPHKMQSLNSVTIRIYYEDPDQPAGMANLGPDDVHKAIAWLRAAAEKCWGPEDPAPP